MVGKNRPSFTPLACASKTLSMEGGVASRNKTFRIVFVIAIFLMVITGVCLWLGIFTSANERKKLGQHIARSRNFHKRDIEVKLTGPK
jgi:hypothetical protein